MTLDDINSALARNPRKQAMGQRDIHLSVVATSRNDDHGGDMLGKMQHFVDGFIAQCRRHDLAAELILVEWNPPAGRPPLAEALSWPDDLGPCEIRIVTVPREIHAQFEHAKSLPLFQMIAKNIGIRRARGTYVLATNVDILFNDKLFVYMRDRLRPGRLVRVDRFDVTPGIPAGVPFDRVLDYCDKHFYRIATKFGILDIIDDRPARRYGGALLALTSSWYRLRIPRLRPKLEKRPLRPAWSPPRALGAAAAQCGRAFSRALRAAATRCRRAFSRLGTYASKIFPLSRLPIRAYWLFYRVARAAVIIAVRLARFSLAALGYILTLGRGIGFRTTRRLRRSLQIAPLIGKVHTNACGDFTLLSREDWFTLRGYPELHIFSWHVDSVLVHASYHSGIKQVMLGPEFRIYHMHQEVGSGWSPEGQKILFERLDAKGIPYLSDEDFSRWSDRMGSNSSERVLNDPQWGLADVVLPEVKVCRRRMASSLEASVYHANI